MNSDAEVTRYFPGEGRAYMRDCLHLAVEWCIRSAIDTLVVFTGTGEGPHYAATILLPQPQYSALRIVAVTPPAGRPYRVNPGDRESPIVRAGIAPAMKNELGALGIPVVSAHLPFKEIYDGHERRSEWARVAEAYGVLGGGFALCVQAALVACDAGAVEHGQRIVALTADTAIAVVPCRTESFLSPKEGLLVEHVICRPKRYTISKRDHELLAPPIAETIQAPTLPRLPPAPIETLPTIETKTSVKRSKLAKRPKKKTPSR